MSKETVQNSFRCAGIPLESQADAVEDTDVPFKSFKSYLDNLEFFDPALVPNCITAKDFTDAHQILSVSESASVDDHEILNHYRDPQSIALTSDNDDEESSEEPGPPKRPARSEVFATLELLQNCSYFEEEQAASDLRSDLEKFSVLYKKALNSRKEQAKVDFSRGCLLLIVVVSF